MSTEIKPSFSLKYILLVLVTATLTSGITILIQNYQDKEISKKIALSIRGGANELKSSNNKSIISVKYSLKNDTSEVKGYYRKTITLNNIGNAGLENIKCKVISKDSNIILIPNPKFDSYPKEIGQIDLKIDNKSNTQNDIIVPLLNANEGISITYEAYSKKPIPFLDLEVSVRQKNLEVERTDKLVIREESKLLNEILNVLYYGLIIIAFFIAVMTCMFYNNWKKYPEIRTRHRENFWTYWWHGY